MHASNLPPQEHENEFNRVYEQLEHIMVIVEYMYNGYLNEMERFYGTKIANRISNCFLKLLTNFKEIKEMVERFHQSVLNLDPIEDIVSRISEGRGEEVDQYWLELEESFPRLVKHLEKHLGEDKGEEMEAKTLSLASERFLLAVIALGGEEEGVVRVWREVGADTNLDEWLERNNIHFSTIPKSEPLLSQQESKDRAIMSLFEDGVLNSISPPPYMKLRPQTHLVVDELSGELIPSPSPPSFPVSDLTPTRRGDDDISALGCDHYERNVKLR